MLTELLCGQNAALTYLCGNEPGIDITSEDLQHTHRLYAAIVMVQTCSISAPETYLIAASVNHSYVLLSLIHAHVKQRAWFSTAHNTLA